MSLQELCRSVHHSNYSRKRQAKTSCQNKGSQETGERRLFQSRSILVYCCDILCGQVPSRNRRKTKVKVDSALFATADDAGADDADEEDDEYFSESSH